MTNDFVVLGLWAVVLLVFGVVLFTATIRWRRSDSPSEPDDDLYAWIGATRQSEDFEAPLLLDLESEPVWAPAEPTVPFAREPTVPFAREEREHLEEVAREVAAPSFDVVERIRRQLESR